MVIENLRQLCVHRVANESSRSWVWWDYVTDFHIRCSMKEKKYSKACSEDVMKSLGKMMLSVVMLMLDVFAMCSVSLNLSKQICQLTKSRSAWVILRLMWKMKC